MGPDPQREQVHLASLPRDRALGTVWVVYFHPDEARWIDEAHAAPDSGHGG